MVAVVVAVMAILVGVAVGLPLRPVSAWCPQCGADLTCRACARRPSWRAPWPAESR